MIRFMFVSALLVISTFGAAVLHFIPIFGPLLAPFVLQAAAQAGFWREAVLNLCCAGHGAMLGAGCATGHNEMTGFKWRGLWGAPILLPYT